MDVSIIIVNYNTGQLLQNCIQSIHDKTAGLFYEVIVVDNASDDGSVEMTKNHHPDVKILECRENLGFGRGNNLAMRKAAGKYFFLLNPDTLLLNNAIKIMFDFMEKADNRNIAVCGASLYGATQKPAVSFGKFPTLGSMILYSIPLSILFRGNDGLVLSEQRDPFAVDFVTGADFFVRQESINSAGDFDEKYFAYYEESDLTKRLAKLGYHSVIVPDAKIIHLEGKSFKGTMNRKKIMFESSLYYLHKFYPNSMLFKIYCRMNETKFKIYKILSPAANSSHWSEMISASKYYRANSE
ncbi:MAG TPA: glycosyltransferase family 2 protein [Patescibacteria group bacterium]